MTAKDGTSGLTLAEYQSRSFVKILANEEEHIDFLETAKKLGADAILRKLDPKERILAEIDRLLAR